MGSGRIVKFNGQSHRLNSVHPAIDSTVEMTGFGEPWLKNVRWTLDFRLIDDALGDDLDTQIANIESMYSQTGADIRITDDQGVDTAHVIEAGASLGGVRVVKPPSYLKYTKGEHVTYRTGTVVVEATIPLFTSDTLVVQLEEEVDVVSGGERWAMLQPNEGFAIRQRVRTNESASVIQSGRIVHAGTFGSIPPPLFNTAQKEPVKVKRRQLRRIGGGYSIAARYVEFEQRYTYTFEWPTTLNAFPTKWN